MKRLCLLITSIVVATTAFQSSLYADPTPAKWVDLLANNSLKAWRSYSLTGSFQNWNLKNGVLHLKEKSGDIITKEQYRNFDFELEWKINAKGNSGVLYLVRTGDKKVWHSGPEYQLIDNSVVINNKMKKLSQTTGSLYGLVAPANAKVNPPGQWNHTRIRVYNNGIEHWLNGNKVVSIRRGSPKWFALVKESKFAKYKQFAAGLKGHICLQDHGTETWFRNVRVRRLK